MMKWPSRKQLLQNKWVIPISAMALTLAIGSFALAGTGSYSFVPPATATTVSTQAQVFSTTSTSLPALPFSLTEAAVPDATVDAAALELEQAKENAILDLIREKMTAADQAVFDQLRTVAGQQQQTLSQAQADLQATKAQITALIDKYLGVSAGGTPDAAAAQTAGTTESTLTNSTSLQ